tara:strand:- start:224 stop:454 length:231 start_codon:yes stop_codon:yes gene_type:complete
MESNNSYNSKAYENLKSLEATYCQLCGITNSKQFDCEIYDYLPHEIDIDEFTKVYSKRIQAQIDVIKSGKKIIYVI